MGVLPGRNGPPDDRAQPDGPDALVVCGLDELPLRLPHGATHVISILDPEHPEPAVVRMCRPHRRLRLRFHDAIEPNAGVTLPTPEDVERIVAFGAASAPAPRLLVHCHFGISRSTAAMAILIARREPSLTGDEVFQHLLRIRRRAWPNSLMIGLADAILGRDGGLTMALGRLYRTQTQRVPEIAHYMREHRRLETEMADRADRELGATP